MTFKLLLGAAVVLCTVTACGSSTALTTPLPAPAPVTTVHGSLAASRYWGPQNAYSCAPNAARVLLSVVKGKPVNENAVESMAAGWANFGPAGTTWERMPQLIGMFGVASNLKDDATLDDLRVSLDAGAPAVVMINANPLWAIFGLAGPTNPAVHAVAVIQIDDAAHLVTLVDSAWPGGRTETVPTAIFQAGWDELGDSAMIVAQTH